MAKVSRQVREVVGQSWLLLDAKKEYSQILWLPQMVKLFDLSSRKHLGSQYLTHSKVKLFNG